MKIKNSALIGSFAFILFFGFSIPHVMYAEEIAPTSTIETTTSTETAPIIESASASSTDPILPIIETSTSTTETTSTITTDTSTVISDSTTTSENTPSAPSADTAKLTIRLDNTIIFSGAIDISPATTTVIDDQGINHDISGNTVLGMIHNADTASTLFDVTDLAYYSSFDSFLINCIKASENPSCYNWQYTVNDVYPYVGIDKYNLKNNDDVYLYFGNQNQFTLSTTTVKINEPLEITTEKYDYRNNAWVPRPNVTVGGTKFDPANPWTPIVVTSTVADSLGKATLYFTATGTLDIGIGDDYYYPTQTITILDVVNTTTSTDSTATTSTTPTTSTTTNNSGGSSGTSSANTQTVPTFDVPKAIQFLDTQQNQTTGAIGSATLYSDWAAVAIGSYSNSGATKTKLSTYLQTDPSPGTSATDFERRAMALMSLGINPYSGTKTNYINEIFKTYQNSQFGDTGLVNDDIFALIPLLKAGYTTTDTEIKNSVAFILSRQNSAGGWESPDLTAAAVQALSQVNSLPGVNDALSKAKNYLKLNIKSDGRIGDNAFSTSWGIQALNVLGESTENSRAYLATQQQTDGGLELLSSTTDNRLWSTSYAIPAAQNKSWSDILLSFAKPVPPTTSGQTNTNNNSANGTDITTTTTSVITTTTTPTVIITTTTPKIIITPTSTISAMPSLITETITNNQEIPNIPVPIVITVDKKPKINPRPIITTAISKNLNKQTSSETKNPNTSGENLSAPSPQTPVSNARRVFGGAAAVAGSAAAYLAWRFAQSLV